MSKAIVCNYCKEEGHRIHKYVGSGERVVTCPILIRKEGGSKKQNVDEEFPPLPGVSATAESTEVACGIMKAITEAKKKKKQSEWAEREAVKKEKKEKWEQYQMVKLEEKYGPLWFRHVEGTKEDLVQADILRNEWDRERMFREEQEYYIQEEEATEWKKKWEKERKEREDLRALMTYEEREQDIWDEDEEMDADLWADQCSMERQMENYRLYQLEEKALFEAKGWVWLPK